MAVGLSESEKEALLERHMADLAMQQDAREEERRRQREMLEVSRHINYLPSYSLAWTRARKRD